MDAPVKPRTYEPGCLTFALEDIGGIVGRIASLARDFAAENKSPIAWAAPTPDALLDRQGSGYLTFTASHGAEIVGYCAVRAVRDGAADAGMYLAPEHRKGWNAVEFVRYVQDALRAMGAKWMVWECDEASQSARMAEYLDLELLSQRYIVVFDKEAAT